MSNLTCPRCEALYSEVGKHCSHDFCNLCHNLDSREYYKRKIEKQKQEISEGVITVVECKHCNVEKPVSEFNVQLKYCKLCSSQIQKEYNKKQETIQSKEDKIAFVKSNKTAICIECKEEKSQESFSDRTFRCKDCVKRRNAENYQKNKDKIKNATREYRNRRKELNIKPNITEKLCKQCNEIKLIDEFSFYSGKGFSSSCKTCYNKDRKEHRDANKETINARRRENGKTKVRTQNSLLSKLRKYVNFWLYNFNGSKTKTAKEFLGCEISFFNYWVKFNCDIDNYSYERLDGLWHIDHVIPCSLFNWNNEQASLPCFHWTNMIPLEKTKNLSKQNRIVMTQVALIQDRLVTFMKQQSLTEQEINQHMTYWQTTYSDMIKNTSKKYKKEYF